MSKERFRARPNEKVKTKPKEKETKPEIKDPNEPPVPILTRKDYGYGKEGTPIKVKVNSFEVTEISKYDKFLKYNIEINPIDKDIEADVKRERSDYGKNIRRRVLTELGLKMEDWFQGVVYAYDGGATLYTTDRLGFDKVEDAKPVVREEISLVDFKNLDGESTRYNVIINRLDTVIELTQLKKYISGEEFEWEFFSDEAFNVLNSLIHKVGAENEKYVQSGKSSIYSKGMKKKISNGVELWFGWFSTVRPGQGSLFVNVNPTFTTFYQPLRLDAFLLEYLRFQSLPRDFKPFYLKKINEIIKGVLVRPLHLGVQTERRIKKLLTGKKVTYFKYKPKANSKETYPLEKYFNENYNIKEPTGLFVEIMTDDDTSIAWPIEFCKIIEGQRYSNKKLTNDPTGVGMKVEPKMTEVDARRLESTDVNYAGKVMKPINGQWNLKDVKFVESGERLEFWHVVIFEQSRWISKADAVEFIKNLGRQCELQGVNIARVIPDIQHLQYMGPGSIKNAYEEAKKRLKRPPQMIVFIIPGEKSPINTELYEAIKRIMDTEIGCLSQCVSVDSENKLNIRGEEVLFLGADVTHPKDKTGRSICAVVGSLDNQAARFITKYRDQERSGLEEILILLCTEMELANLNLNECSGGNFPRLEKHALDFGQATNRRSFFRSLANVIIREFSQ